MSISVTRPVLGGQTGNSFSSWTTQPADSNIRYVDDKVEKLDPTMTPLTSAIGVGKEIDSQKVEWHDDRIAPLSDTLAAAATAGATGIVVTNVARFQQNMVLRIGAENLLVTAINDGTSTLTVVRGVGGTPAGAPAAGAAVEIIGTAFPQSSDISPAPVARGIFYHNFMQRFGGAIKVDYAQNVSANYLRETPEYNKELAKQMVQGKIHRERALFLGARAAPSGALPGFMGGFDGFITQHVTAYANNAPLTEADLLDELQEAYDDVGEANIANTVICKTFTKRLLSSWFSHMQADVQNRRATDVVDRYETDMGTLSFLNHHWCPPSTLYIVRTANFKIHPHKAMNWFEEVLPHYGPYHQGMYVGEFTGIFRGDRSHVKITGFSVNRNDYPTLNR